jgi:hypothetical protein
MPTFQHSHPNGFTHSHPYSYGHGCADGDPNNNCGRYGDADSDSFGYPYLATHPVGHSYTHGHRHSHLDTFAVTHSHIHRHGADAADNHHHNFPKPTSNIPRHWREKVEETMPTGQETRVKNATTGGEKGSKLSQLGSAPAEALALLGEVYGFGAEKYERHNFRKGYAWSLSYDAMLRHIMASLRGEDYDAESGLPHMAHAAWHALTLTQFLKDKEAGRHPAELDDRYA